MQGHSIRTGTRSNVVATVGAYHTLIVNKKGELYITYSMHSGKSGNFIGVNASVTKLIK